MTRRRPGFGGWISRLRSWQLGLSFLIAAGVVGSGVLAGVSTFERTYGVLASWMGWATERGVKQELQPIVGQLDRQFQWQLYETIRRLQRNVDDLKARPAPTRADQERLAEMTEQLAEVKAEYATVKKKGARP